MHRRVTGQRKRGLFEHLSAVLMGVFVVFAFLVLVGGLTWASFGGSSLTGGRGAATAFLLWPALGLAVIALLVAGERLADQRVGESLASHGLRSLGELVLYVGALAAGAAFLVAMIRTLLAWAPPGK
jgi:hypothetical protein